MNRGRAAPALVLGFVLAQPIGRSAFALRSADSTRTDSVPRRIEAEGLMLPAMAVFMGVLAVAPPALLFLPSHPDTSLRALSSAHVAAYVAAGGMGESGPNRFTHSENLDVYFHNLTGTVTIEHFGPYGGARFATVRAGYLFNPDRWARGGFTLGYRRASGPGTESALEIGLPFKFGNQRAIMLFMPTYLVSHQGVMWNYRFEGDFLTLPKPLYAGMLVEAKSLRQNGKGFGSATLFLGLRW